MYVCGGYDGMQVFSIVSRLSPSPALCCIILTENLTIGKLNLAVSVFDQKISDARFNTNFPKQSRLRGSFYKRWYGLWRLTRPELQIEIFGVWPHEYLLLPLVPSYDRNISSWSVGERAPSFSCSNTNKMTSP